MRLRNRTLEWAMASTGVISLATDQDAAVGKAFLHEYDIEKQQQLMGRVASELPGRRATQRLRNAESRRHQACGHCHRSLHLPTRPRRGPHYPDGSIPKVAACG